MAKKGCKQQRAAFAYPKHALSPEDLLHFIETAEFTKTWEALGLDDEDDLMALQLGIMAHPKGPPVIKDTGGLRKLRFAPAQSSIGKRGGVRVCYVYFEEHGIVLLVVAYPKTEKDDLTPDDRKGIRKFINVAKKELDRRKTIQ